MDTQPHELITVRATLEDPATVAQCYGITADSAAHWLFWRTIANRAEYDLSDADELETVPLP